MLFTDNFFVDIKNIHLAHECTLDRVNKCEYPSGRSHYGIVYVISGKAKYRFYGGETVEVTDGDLLFLSPDAAYSIVTDNEFRHQTVNFDINKANSTLGILGGKYYMLKTENAGNIKQCFERLTGIWQSRKACFEMQAIGCLYELLTAFYLNYTGKISSPATQRLVLVKEYIDKHFDEPICLEDLAKLANMSVTNFRREWKKRYTEAPLQYRDSIRLYYAREYLDIGYYNVTTIAEKCGFDDVSYFIRFFKKKTGMTPCEYKKRAVM